MNMLERLKLIVDMAAIRSRIMGTDWRLQPVGVTAASGSVGIRTSERKQCPLAYLSKQNSWTMANYEFGLDKGDESTNGRNGFNVFLDAADGYKGALEDLDDPAYKLRQHMLVALKVGV